MSGWIYLGFAIILEVAGTTCMKLSNGFSRLLPSLLMGVSYVLSFSALTMALKQIPVSTAYAIWSGVGTALIAIIGFALFKESITLMKIGSLLMIILGVLGLRMNL
jgi:small multidrug resistance pump